jgi:hypothetical protein
VKLYRGRKKMERKIEVVHFEVALALHVISWIQADRARERRKGQRDIEKGHCR